MRSSRGCGADGQVRFEIEPNQSASVSSGLLPAGLIDQDAPHGLGGGGEEVAAVVPACCVGRPDEPQIRLVDEGGCVQSVAGGFFGHPGGRQFPQLFVDQRQQLFGGVGFAVGKVRQDAGHFVNGCAPVETADEFTTRAAANPRFPFAALAPAWLHPPTESVCSVVARHLPSERINRECTLCYSP